MKEQIEINIEFKTRNPKKLGFLFFAQKVSNKDFLWYNSNIIKR